MTVAALIPRHQAIHAERGHLPAAKLAGATQGATRSRQAETVQTAVCRVQIGVFPIQASSYTNLSHFLSGLAARMQGRRPLFLFM